MDQSDEAAQEGIFSEYQEHFDQDGNKTGWSEDREGVFTDYTEHYDNDGNSTGWSEDREGVFTDYTEHYDSDGDSTGWSEDREGVFTDYTEHFGANPKIGSRSRTKTTSKATSANSSRSSATGGYSSSVSSTGGTGRSKQPEGITSDLVLGLLSIFAPLLPILGYLVAAPFIMKFGLSLDGLWAIPGMLLALVALPGAFVDMIILGLLGIW